MKSLFDKNDCNEMMVRIRNLQPASHSQWGTMSVTQMLAHCQKPLRISLGVLTARRSFAGMLFGKLAKKRVMTQETFKKNLPTDRSFKVVNTLRFEDERRNLLKLLEQFSARGNSGIRTSIHPFFGKLAPEEWDRIMWMHIDHHLRQFEV